MGRFREDGSYFELGDRVYFLSDRPRSDAFNDNFKIVHDKRGQPVSKEQFISMLEEEGQKEAGAPTPEAS